MKLLNKRRSGNTRYSSLKGDYPTNENSAKALTSATSYAILIPTYRKGGLPMKQMIQNTMMHIAAMPVIVYSVIENLHPGEV